jgi:hypothetical protein
MIEDVVGAGRTGGVDLGARMWRAARLVHCLACNQLDRRADAPTDPTS